MLFWPGLFSQEISSPPASNNPDLFKPIPLLTLTNADVHKFVIGKTQAYASVGKIDNNPKEGKYVNLVVWDLKQEGGVFDFRQKIDGLNPADKKFVMDWLALHGPDGRKRSSPALVPGGQGIASFMHSYLVDLSGVLKDKAIVAIAGGGVHALVLCADGTLAAWGRNEYGELGNDKDGFDTYSVEPVLVDMAPFKGRKVTAIAVTGGACLALCEDGSLFTWGSFAWNGHIGSTIIPHNRPALFAEGALKGRKVATISALETHCIALCSDGRLVEWGIDVKGHEVALKPPALVDNQGALQGKTITKVVAMQARGGLVLCSDGTLVFWGDGLPGVVEAARKAMGLPQPASTGMDALQIARLNHTDTPLALVDETGARKGKTVTDIGLDNSALYALCSDGTLVAWESAFPANSGGQRGAANANQAAQNQIARPNPIVLSGKGMLKNKTIRTVAGESNTCLYVCTDNSLVEIVGPLSKPMALDSNHILESRTVQAVTPNGLVLFQQPGGEGPVSVTPAQP